jgi:hypothetical protein
MQSAHPKPILNTSLPVRFRQIRIEVAREHDHPEGDAGVAYVIVAPLWGATGLIRYLGESTARHAGSRDCGRIKRINTAVSFTARAAGGRFTTMLAPILQTRSNFTLRINVL